MANIIPGETLQILQKNWHGSMGESARWEKHEVLQVFPHHVLFRNLRGGYRECFTWYQLYEGRVIDRAELAKHIRQGDREGRGGALGGGKTEGEREYEDRAKEPK